MIMHWAKSLLVAVGVVVSASVPAALTPAQVNSLPSPAPGPVVFGRDIQPIFEASCVVCHGHGKAKGGFRLDTRETFLAGGNSGPAAVAGDSARSRVVELVAGLDPDSIMPVKGSKLTRTQVGLMRAWIDQGLPWPPEISFGKRPPLNLQPRRPALPPETAATGAHPVDRLLQAYFEKNQIPFRPVVNDRLFARRVYLDTIGLLPTPEDLAVFAADPRSDKRLRLIEQLLAKPAPYAEHWLSFWNDLLRNDYQGTGYIDGGRQPISRWLYSALAGNKPYDRLVAELVNPGPASQGFINGIVWRGAVNASQRPPLQAAQNISQVFLGVNLKCASCHNSFINDWTLADAYGLASVYSDKPLEMFECDKPTGETVEAKFLFPEMGAINPKASPAEKRQRLAALLTAKEDGRLARTVINRLWARLLGRGLVEPVDDMDQTAWCPDLLDWLAEDFIEHGYDLKHALARILSSRACQRPAVSLDEQRRADYVFTGPVVRRMTAEEFRDALGSLTDCWFESPATDFDFSSALPTLDPVLMPRAAQWIWSEPDANVKAPPGRVYFWKRFGLEAVPANAVVVAAGDDRFTLFVNGQQALTGHGFARPGFADIRAYLRPGENVFAVVAVNETNPPPAASAQPPAPSSADQLREREMSPAGFLLYARLRQGEKVLDLVSDASWTCAHTVSQGWEKPEYLARETHPAVALGAPSLAPWHLGQALTNAVLSALIHGRVRASLVPADPLTTALGRPNRDQVNTTRATAATTLQGLELTNGETLSRLLERGASQLVGQQSASNSELVTRLYLKALGRAPSVQELAAAQSLRSLD